jgi:UDP-glucose 4-epimerase
MPQPAIGERDVRAAFDGARVLVTGAAGFIGSQLTHALAGAGADVTALDRAHPAVALAGPRFVPVEVGGAAFRTWYHRAGSFDYVFHLAARAYAAASVQAPYDDFAANLWATVNLLELLRAESRPPHLVFASSAAVYGNPATLPIGEDAPLVPLSPYGVSKLAAERYVAVYAQLYGIPAASLRLFSVYGPGQRKQVVYDLFARLHESPQLLTVLGDGSQVRDLVFVGDVVRAFMVIAARGRRDGFAYNVASGVGTSTAELARRIVQIQGTAARIVFTGATRPGDPERWLGRCEALAALGAAPVTPLSEGLQLTADWFNQAHPAFSQEVSA